MVLKIDVHFRYTHYFLYNFSYLHVFINFQADVYWLIISEIYVIFFVTLSIFFLLCLKHAFHFVRESVHDNIEQKLSWLR